MTFNWDWKNSCVVYEWWQVKTLPGLLGTLIALVVISMLYEFSRAWVAAWNRRNKPPQVTGPPTTTRATAIKSSVLYAFLVGYSFMLMLVFMTYNGYYMLAVLVGAGIGHYIWAKEEPQAKPLICH